MHVQAFDHINLRAPRALLDQLRDFYRDVVGLEVGQRPPFERFGYWLYAGGRPVLHLGEAYAHELSKSHVDGTYSHVSFLCRDRAGYERRLKERAIDYQVAVVPLTGIVQLFFTDPAGNGVELGFPASEAPRA